MKKILALILCITMFAGIMTSCGKGNGNEQATTTENKTEVLAPDVWNGDILKKEAEANLILTLLQPQHNSLI